MTLLIALLVALIHLLIHLIPMKIMVLVHRKKLQLLTKIL